MRLLFYDFTLPYLMADSNYPVGGWAVQLYSWIKGLRANGHHVGVLTWEGANQYVNKELDFEMIETYDPKKGLKVVKYLYYYIPTIYKKSVKYNPDVIIQACAGLNTGIMAFIAGRINVPFVHRVANDVDADQRYRLNLLKYEQKSYEFGLKRANIILCQNSYQYDQLKGKYKNKRCDIIYNPFFSEHLTMFEEPIEGRTFVAWVGVFKKQKNLTLLHQIAQLMPKTIFKIAGGPGRNMDNVTKTALSKLENLSNVEFVGYLSREDLFSFLSKAVVLLNTSHYEGFSNTFLEAFSTGTPVVAPENVDPDHIIQRHGLGAAVNDFSNFPSFIKQITENENIFNETSQRCRKYVHENHNPKLLAKRLVEILSPICGISCPSG